MNNEPNRRGGFWGGVLSICGDLLGEIIETVIESILDAFFDN